MNRFFLLVVALVATAQILAQNCAVTGTVEDGISGDPLVGAYVQSSAQITATDIDGRFQLTLPKFLQVSYSHEETHQTIKDATRQLNKLTQE